MSTLGRVFGLAAALVFVSACGGGGDGDSGAQPPPATTHSVTTSVAGSGSGTISPTSRTVSQGSTLSFTISPAVGSAIGSVNGCGGSLNGTTYTTGAIHSSCTVSAVFSLTCEGAAGTERNFSYDWSLETEKVTFTNNNTCDGLFVWATSTPLCDGCVNTIIDVAKEVSPGETIVMDAGVPLFLSWKPSVIYSLGNGDTYEYKPIQAGSITELNVEILLLDHADYHLGQLARFSEMFSIDPRETIRGDCHSFSWLDRDQGHFQIAPNPTSNSAFCFVGNIEGYTASGDREWLPPLDYFVTEKSR